MLYPLVLLIVAIGGYSCWIHSRSRGSRLVVIGVLGLFLFSWRPFACVVQIPLQYYYFSKTYPDSEAEAIVVLAGGMERIAPAVPTPMIGRGTYGRCEYAAYLFRSWHRLPVLVSGGQVEADEPPAAYAMGRFMEREGIPASMIWYEDQSLSTHQNALYAAEILRKRGIHKIVLVTDGFHMLRAEKCFRKQGFAVIAAPSTLRRFGPFQFNKLLPSWEPILWNEEATHEILAMFWYRIRGWA